MAWQASDIGVLYDVGLSTRDGSTVSCLDAGGNPVPVSSIAYMCSADKGKTMKEATELQEKSKLIQLGTSETIDREFDQWVQNTQGDWSAGLGQRVYGQQGVTNAYFDGEGLLWPLNDWIPQKSLPGPAQDVPTPAGSTGPAGPDSGTETIAPGGSATVKAMSCCFASFAPTGVAALVGVKGAFTQGSNVAVTPPYGQVPTAGNLLIAEVGGQRQNTTAPANLGETAAANSSFNFSGANTDNEVGTDNTFTVPAGGITVSSISENMGGHTGAVNTRFVIWNASSGAKIVSSATFAAAKGRSLKTKAITPVFIAAGTVLRIGFWRQQSQDAEWGVAAAGTFRYHSNVGNENAQPNLVCAPAYVCGHIQAYITYTTGATSDITGSAGWVKVAQRNSPDGFQQSQIWNKIAVGADAAPTFSAAQGGSPMHAQVEEWSGLAAALPAVDQFSTATSSLLTSVTATNPATDAGAGDLVIMAVRSQLSIAATAGFTEAFNNGITAIALGSSAASSLVNHSSFSYGIAPAGGAITFTSWAINGTAGGYVEGLGMGYAVAYLDSQGPPGHWHVTFFSGDQSYDVDLGANTGGQQGPLHMHIAAGYLWVLFSNYPNASTLRVIMLGCNYGSNAFVQLRSDALPAVGGTSGFFGLLAASYVGGKLYVAVLQADQNIQPGAPAANRNALFIGDYSAGVGSAPTGLAAAVLVFPFTRGFKEVDLVWQGNTLVLAVGDGLDAYIYTVVSPFTAITTQAVIPGIANALLCAVGGTLFIVGWTQGPGGINRMDLYTLNGGALTELPFTPIVPFLDSVTSPTTFGSYALWAVSYATPSPVPPYASTVLAKNPAGYWRAGEASGALADSTASQIAATPVGAPTYGVPGAISNDPNTAVATPAGAYFTAPSLVDISGRNPYTFAVSIKPTTIDGVTRRQIGIEQAGNKGSNFNLTNLGFGFRRSDAGAVADSIAGPVPSIGTWTRYVGTYDGTTMRLYINGVEQGNIASSRLCAPGAGAFEIGSSGGVNNGDSAFDEIAIFPYAWDPAQVLDDYTMATTTRRPAIGEKTVTVYAYDAVRNRLFRALTFTDPSWTGSDVFGHDVIALYGVTQRTLAVGATFQSQLGLAIFSGQLSNNAESAREFYWGITPIAPAPAFSGLLQMGVDIISGLFDFTAATNKLFRAIVSHFIDGLVPGLPSPSVTLNAWFDQDPNRLNQAPDFTANTGPAPNPLPAQLDLDLFTNRVARKLVYEVISDGGGFDLGSNSWQNAPKITDVIVQAATGWVWDFVFDLAPGAKTNSNNAPAYSNQSDPAAAFTIDQVVAYNFLRKLWREKGGECTITLPNGDVYSALIQLEEFESPKPFAVSARSDQPTQWQEFVTVKIREDI